MVTLAKLEDIIGDRNHESLFQSRDVELDHNDFYGLGSFDLGSFGELFGRHVDEDATVSNSAVRPSGETGQTYAASAGSQGVMTYPVWYDWDGSQFGYALPEEVERIQDHAAENQQNLELNTMMTEYSVSKDKQHERYMMNLATDLFEEVKTYDADPDTLERLSELLPDLLRAFSVKIGHQARSQTDLDISYFVQTHGGYIARTRSL